MSQNLEYRWGDSPLDTAGIPAWLKDGPGEWKTFSLPWEPPERKGRRNLWLRIKLPDTRFEDPALMTWGVHQVFHAYLDGNIIYRFGEFDEGGRGVFPGYRWHHIIPLLPGYEGKYAYFRIYSHFQNIGFSSMMLDTQSRHIRRIIQRDIYKFMVGILFVMVGLSTLIFFLVRKKKKIALTEINERIYLFFSIFTIAMGITVTADTALKELLFDSPHLWIHVRLSSMSIFGVGIGGFLLHIEEIRYKKILTFFFRAHVVYAGSSILLSVTGLVPVMSTILPFNILLLLSIVFVFFCIISSSIGGNIDAIIFTAGFSVLLALAVRDALMDMGIFPRGDFAHHWGMLVFILSLGIILSRRFSATYDQFHEYRQSVELARNIQWSTLPKSIPGTKGLRIAAQYIPMERVGGDYYGFHPVDENRVGILVADVSGHGIPAAMISSMIRLSFDLAFDHSKAPSRLLSTLNQMLINKIEDNFITASYCYFDMELMKLKNGNAGHPPLYIWKGREKMIQDIRPRGRLLGRFTEINSVTREIDIRPGDKIILCTDGIIETVDRKGEFYGEDRFKEFIALHHRLPSGEFISLLLKNLRKSSGRDNEAFDDDITIIVIDVL